MKLKVLFVDDEKKVLSSLKRLFYNKKDEWEMDFVLGGRDALKQVKEIEYDVVISDMHMPGIDGAYLLEQIQTISPYTLRFILSGYSDIDLVKKTLKVTHKFFHKPCPKDKLENVINRVVFLRKLLPDKALREKINQIGVLPCNPLIYAMLVEALSKSDLKIFQDTLYYDVCMFLNIFKIIMNSFFVEAKGISSFFKLLHNIDLSILETIFLSQEIFLDFSDFTFKDFSINEIWRHSRLVAYFSKAIAQTLYKDYKFIEDCFIAGLLHDIGIILMLLIFKERYLNFLKKNFYKSNFVKKELDEFKCSHALVGAYLVGLWGANLNIIEAIAFHAQPSLIKKKKLSPLSIIHYTGVYSLKNINPFEEEIDINLDFTHYKNMISPSTLKKWNDICANFLKMIIHRINKKIL